MNNSINICTNTMDGFTAEEADDIHTIAVTLTGNRRDKSGQTSKKLYNLQRNHSATSIISAITQELLELTADSTYAGTLPIGKLDGNISLERKQALAAIYERLKRELVLPKYIAALEKIMPPELYIRALLDGRERKRMSDRGVEVFDVPTADEVSALTDLRSDAKNLSTPLKRTITHYLAARTTTSDDDDDGIDYANLNMRDLDIDDNVDPDEDPDEKMNIDYPEDPGDDNECDDDYVLFDGDVSIRKSDFATERKQTNKRVRFSLGE